MAVKLRSRIGKVLSNTTRGCATSHWNVSLHLRRFAFSCVTVCKAVIGWVYQCATNRWLETRLAAKLDLLLCLNIAVSLLATYCLCFLLRERSTRIPGKAKRATKRTMTFLFSQDGFCCCRVRAQTCRMRAHSGNRFYEETRGLASDACNVGAGLR